jgi:hypothetical protein
MLKLMAECLGGGGSMTFDVLKSQIVGKAELGNIVLAVVMARQCHGRLERLYMGKKLKGKNMNTFFLVTYFCPTIFLPQPKNFVPDELSTGIDNDML